ncbi:MAG: DUF4340 domain-containing protein [Deltaproteobacteria bacterium]|nr:DUF4340 domain-containing protein [Deltaproteobacteria bacterium]
MKIKKEMIILVLIILVASLYLIMQNKGSINYELPELEEIVVSDITKITIDGKDVDIVLQKKDNSWFIEPQGYLIVKDMATDMLEAIEKPVLTDLISESKNYAQFELDDESRTVVKAYAGSTLIREMTIGKMASSYSHTHIKMTDDYRVYYAMGNLKNPFSKNIDELRDKAVLSLDQDDIKEVHMVQGSESVTLVKSEIQKEEADSEEAQDEAQVDKTSVIWTDPDGEQASTNQVDKIISKLSSLSCDQYIYDTSKSEMADPICTVTLKGEKEYSLSIFAMRDEEDKMYPAISSGSDYPFVLQSYPVDSNIMIEIDTLMGRPEPEAADKET